MLFIELYLLIILIVKKKGPDTFDSPDFPPLLVLCELLHTMEGIFWKLIRGQGLAYGIRLRVSPESGNYPCYHYHRYYLFEIVWQ